MEQHKLDRKKHQLSSVTDWPDGLEDSEELLEILKRQIGTELSKKNISEYLVRLHNNLGFSGNVWKAEAITGLLELFQFYPDINMLDDIFVRILEAADKKIST